MCINVCINDFVLRLWTIAMKSFQLIVTVYYLDEFTSNCGCYQDAASIVIVLT